MLFLEFELGGPVLLPLGYSDFQPVQLAETLARQLELIISEYFQVIGVRLLVGGELVRALALVTLVVVVPCKNDVEIFFTTLYEKTT